MTVSIIAAVANDGLIGRDNQLPWHLPRDLKRFRALTMGKPIVMGRKTFESLKRPLDGRHNIVLTRRDDLSASGFTIAHSLDEAMTLAAPEREVMIIGGAAVFREALPIADTIHLTIVDGQFQGDVYLDLDFLESPSWIKTSAEDWPPDAKNPFPMKFLTLEQSKNLHALNTPIS
ncbi:dihydrofolate reductase [Singulisphaera rosea]